MAQILVSGISFIKRMALKKPKMVSAVLYIAVVGLILYLTIVSPQQTNWLLRTNASQLSREINLILLPYETNAKVGSIVHIYPKIHGPKDNPIAFVTITLTFNPQHLIFKQVNTEGLDIGGLKFVKSDSPDEANTAGRVQCTFAAENPDRLVSGTITLPDIEFSVVADNKSSLVVPDIENSQVVFFNEETALFGKIEQTVVNSTSIPASTPKGEQ